MMKIRNYIAWTLSAIMLLCSTSLYANWENYEGEVSISQTRPALDRANRVFYSHVTIENQNEFAIQGPIRLLVDQASLPVLNYNGLTDQGVPFFELEDELLNANQKVVVRVEFPFQRARLRFTPSLQIFVSNWDLVWSDEFDGSEIDTSKWSFEVDCWGGGNNEQQCYTDRLDNAFTQDGLLNIVAKREDFTGPAEPNGGFDNLRTLPYTSARLNSANKGDWKYGRIEIRAKMPHGQGTWPAIRMSPTESVYGSWSASGQIDFAQAQNLKTPSDDSDAEAGAEESTIFSTLHYGRAWPENVASGAEYQMPQDQNPADGFHIYEIEWEQDEIRWYVDGFHYATQTSEGWYTQYYNELGELVTGSGDAPFDQLFHLSLSLAIGGPAANANGGGIDEGIFPQAFQVDYVRVYECAVSPETGQGCANVGDGFELVEGNQAPIIEQPEPEPIVELVVYDDGLVNGFNVSMWNPDGIASFSEEFEEDRGSVLRFVKGQGNANWSIGASPMDLSEYMQSGELVFDVNIESTAPGVELLVKMSTNPWPSVSDASVPLPATGEWTEVRIPISTLINNGNRYSPGDAADISNILNVLIVEPTWEMTVKFDNIRLERPEGDGVADVIERLANPLVVFDDTERYPFTLTHFAASGSVDIEEVFSEDTLDGLARGPVKQMTFNTNESVTFFETVFDESGEKIRLDLSDFDYVEFDLKAVDDGREDRSYVVKMECGFPCSSGDFYIGEPSSTDWQSYKITIADLVNNTGSSLDLSVVEVPLAITPNWGNQFGVVMQVDNVRLTKAQTPAQIAASEMGKGFNLGQMFESNQHERTFAAAKPKIDAYYEMGYRNLRIPITWTEEIGGNLLVEDALTGVVIRDHERLAEITQIIDYALSLPGLYVIINAHHEGGLKSNNRWQVLEQLWADIADLYKDKDYRLLYEILNEPHKNVGSPMAAADLRFMTGKAYDKIREVDPERIVIIGGNQWFGAHEVPAVWTSLDEVGGGEDDNLMVTFHHYNPWEFHGNHQGDYSDPWTIGDVENPMDQMQRWADTIGNGMPIYIGEWGTGWGSRYSQMQCNNIRNWYQVFDSEYASQKGQPTAVWDDGGWFKIFDHGTNQFDNNLAQCITGTCDWDPDYTRFNEGCL